MTTKCDMTVSKQMTINTSNYNSIRPSVSVTIKDIDVGDIGKITDDLTTLSQMYLEREILMMLSQKADIDEKGGPIRWAANIDTSETDKVIKKLENDLKLNVASF